MRFTKVRENAYNMLKKESEELFACRRLLEITPESTTINVSTETSVDGSNATLKESISQDSNTSNESQGLSLSSSICYQAN